MWVHSVPQTDASAFPAVNRAHATHSALMKAAAVSGTGLPPTPTNTGGRLQEFPQNMGSVHPGLLIFNFTSDCQTPSNASAASCVLTTADAL